MTAWRVHVDDLGRGVLFVTMRRPRRWWQLRGRLEFCGVTADLADLIRARVK